MNYGCSSNDAPTDVFQGHGQEASYHHMGEWKKKGAWAGREEQEVGRSLESQSHGMSLLRPPPSQRQRPIRKLLISVGKSPGDTFPACVPLSASTRHRRDNEILILSDLGPPRQDHVTRYFNDHNSGNKAWLWRRNSSPCPNPKGTHVTGRNRKWCSKTEHGTPWMLQGPLGTCSAYIGWRNIPTSEFLIATKVSCSSTYGVTPELIKCDSLIVLAIAHHSLLICIILVSIFTNVTWKAVMWLLF